MKTYRGAELQLQTFFTSAEWSASYPVRFTPEEKSQLLLAYDARWTPQLVWTV
jgi:hypothetical protein